MTEIIAGTPSTRLPLDGLIDVLRPPEGMFACQNCGKLYPNSNLYLVFMLITKEMYELGRVGTNFAMAMCKECTDSHLDDSIIPVINVVKA